MWLLCDMRLLITLTAHGRWSKYRGGLSTEDRDGTQSIYTEIEGNEIMFHVSTLLPFHAEAKQQIDRKRHLGNDVVLVPSTLLHKFCTMHTHVCTSMHSDGHTFSSCLVFQRHFNALAA